LLAKTGAVSLSDNPSQGEIQMVSIPAEKFDPNDVVRRILIVDDYQISANGLAKWLRSLGNEVEVAFDGLYAIATAEKFRPDIILLDIGLPDINGYEVAENIRKKFWGRETILIAMTGHGQKEDRRRIQTSGFYAHLVKPLVYKQVLSLLASCPVRAMSHSHSGS
jgi:CheY-like chemotaxis protein